MKFWQTIQWTHYTDWYNLKYMKTRSSWIECYTFCRKEASLVFVSENSQSMSEAVSILCMNCDTNNSFTYLSMITYCMPKSWQGSTVIDYKEQNTSQTRIKSSQHKKSVNVGSAKIIWIFQILSPVICELVGLKKETKMSWNVIFQNLLMIDSVPLIQAIQCKERPYSYTYSANLKCQQK